MYKSLAKHPPFTRKCESKLNNVELVDKLWTRMMLVNMFMLHNCVLCVYMYICICTVYVYSYICVVCIRLFICIIFIM